VHAIVVVPLGASLLVGPAAYANPEPEVEASPGATLSIEQPTESAPVDVAATPEPSMAPADPAPAAPDAPAAQAPAAPEAPFSASVETEPNQAPVDDIATVHGSAAEAPAIPSTPNWLRFFELGGIAALGEPMGPEETYANGTAVLRFANAALYTGRGTGTRLVRGPILERYMALGGHTGPLGLPITDQVNGGRGSQATLFEKGRIYTAAGVGTFEVYGGILSRYLALNNEHGVLGLPTSSETAGAHGSRKQSFQGGRIYWTPSHGAHEVHGAILVKFDQTGADSGPLGPPISGEVAGPAGTRMNHFRNGHVYHGATGTHEVFGAILQRYLAEGGPAGQLGLPISGEEGWDYGRESRFQNGTIRWNAFNGALSVHYAINQSWLYHPRTGRAFPEAVARWAPTVARALQDQGLPTMYVPGVLAQIQQESGGNPNAVNTWDINWQYGYASFGLVQTIAPTYQSFAPPGQRGFVTRINVNGRMQQYVPEMVVPYNNIYAGINYAKTRYGFCGANRPCRLEQWNAGRNYAYGEDVLPPIVEILDGPSLD